MNPYLPPPSSHHLRLDPEFAIIPRPQMGWLVSAGFAVGMGGMLLLTSLRGEVRVMQVGGVVLPLVVVLSLVAQWLSRRQKREELRLVAMAFREPVVRIGEVQREVLGGGRNGVLLLTRESLVFLDPVKARNGSGEEIVPLREAASMVRHLGWKIGDGRLALLRPARERLILRFGNPDAWAIAIRRYDPAREGKRVTD